MRKFRVEFFSIPIKEVNERERNGEKVQPVYTWRNIEAKNYYRAELKILDILSKTAFGEWFKATYRKDLRITHVNKYLRPSPEEDERFSKPNGDYITPLVEELKKLKEEELVHG